jgi:hypothetical protein
VRTALSKEPRRRYGYPIRQIDLRLYVGKFAGAMTGEHERLIRASWAATSVDPAARRVAGGKQYGDNPALAAIKVFEAAGMLLSLSAGYPSSTPGLIIADRADVAPLPRLCTPLRRLPHVSVRAGYRL